MKKSKKWSTKNHDNDRFFLSEREDEILLQEKRLNEIGGYGSDNHDWIAEYEEELRKKKEHLKNECPYLRKLSPKLLPHGGTYEVDSFDERYRLSFARFGRGEKEWSAGNPRFMFFYFIDKQKTKYEEWLSFEEVLAQVNQDILKGVYDKPHPQDYLAMRALNLYEDCSYLGGRASAAWLKHYNEKMDELVIHAFYSLPSLSQSQKPGIKLLIQHYDKRRGQMFDSNPAVRHDAALFWEGLLHWNDRYNKSIFPKRLFITGLVHFLLPIAWNLKDKYLQQFPKDKKTINRPVKPVELRCWRTKVKTLDPRLIQLEDADQLKHLVPEEPKYYIEQHLLPAFFKLFEFKKTSAGFSDEQLIAKARRAIKDRIIAEKRI